MNIAFWAPYGGESAALAGMVAAMISLQYPARTVILDNYSGYPGSGHMLLGKRFEELRSGYQDYGAGIRMEHSFLKHLGQMTGKRTRGRRCLEIVPELLSYIPLNQSLPKELYEYGFWEELPDLFEHCAENFDVTIWNLEGGGNYTTPALLELADYIVVLIPGKWKNFLHFYEEYRSVHSKSILVFRELRQSGETVTQLIRRIRRKFYMPGENLYGLRVSTEFLCAIEEGKVLEYLCAHYDSNKISSEYESVRCIRRLVFSLMRREVPVRSAGYEELVAALLKRQESFCGYYERNYQHNFYAAENLW